MRIRTWLKSSSLLTGILCILLFPSAVFAAPSLFKSGPEPIEHPGALLRERFAQRMGSGTMRAHPASYPTPTVHILFLRVEFQQDLNPAGSHTTGSGLWSDPSYATSGDSDYWVNKAKIKFVDYWNEASVGLLSIAITVSPKIYQMPYGMSHYGNESSAALENLIYDSVFSALTDAADPIAFSDYDAVLVVHAGVGEESDRYGRSSNDIWSLYYSNPIKDQVGVPQGCISPDARNVNCLNVRLRGGGILYESIIMPQTDSRPGITVDPLGVYLHEFGHWLGLPDLYCTGQFCQSNGPDGLGRWSLMADGIYNADPAICPDRMDLAHCVLGSSPAHPDAWSKVYLGFVSPVTAAPGVDLGAMTLQPVEGSRDIFKVQASTTLSSQYFLLENRQQTGFDQGLPGHGLMVWLVDDVIVDNNFSSNTINNTMQRPGIKLIEADNDGNLLTYGCAPPEDCGSPGDPYPGSTGNRSLTPHTVPPSHPYSPFAWVNIKNILESGPPASTISADIGFAPLPPKTPGMNLNVVSWPASIEEDIVGYNVYKNGTFLALTSSPSYTDATARNNDAYRITVVDSAGNESDFSDQVIANMAVVQGGGDSRCFIATAAYGSPLDLHVQALRDFRDRYLLTSSAGRGLVACYYRHSPAAADFIRGNDNLRTAARWTLTPVVFAVEHPALFAMSFLAAGAVLARARKRMKKGIY